MDGFQFTPEDVRTVWNANCGDLPKCNDMGIMARTVKAKVLLTRLAATTGIPNMLRLAEAIQRIAASPYCNGGSANDANPLGFIASFDWFLNPETLTLTEEGRFDPAKEIKPPPVLPASKVLEHWQKEQKPSWEFTEEEFLRCQIQGLLHLDLERKAGHKLPVAPPDHEWMSTGGTHPWATEEEIAKATEKVMRYRKEGGIPKSMSDMRTTLDVPKSFKDLLQARREAKERDAKDQPAVTQEAPETPSQDADDPW